MGCDGGTIPRRDELVRVKKKPETKDKTSELAFQWLCCSISQQKLSSPVVTCGLGRLYNKLALIEGLLNKETLPESAKHIKSLKDVKDLKLTPNPIFKDGDSKERFDDRPCPYICPLSSLEMSGKFRFVALWTCGCVLAERVLKQVNTKNCAKCQTPFVDDDVVILNAKDEDLDLMRERMEKRQIRTKKPKEKKSKAAESCASTSQIQEKNSKLAVKRSGAIVEKGDDGKKMKADYSVAKDPQVSDVYKSIFTTHKSEQEQNRAHWITYNPFYN